MARTPLRSRDARFGISLAALLLVPTLLGFSIAGTDTLEPPPTDGEATRTSTGGTASSNPQVVSGRPVGEAPTSAEDALSRQETDDGGFPRLQYSIEDSGDVRLANGGVIPLGNGLELVVRLDPYPANRFDVDVQYVLRRADGAVIDNATITTVWDMTFMYHGPFETTMSPAGNGAYEASYDFFMFGPWYLDTTVEVPGTPPIDLSLFIYVWPTG